MNKKLHIAYSLGTILLLLIVTVPVYGESFTNTADGKPQPEFIDKNKDPQHYVDRYYNEIKYKLWFDRNYPNYTIEEAVGYTGSEKVEHNSIKNELIPEAQALSSSSEQQPVKNGEFAQIVLAISALAILFAATYGIKKKVEHNSRQISINRNSIKQKIIKPIMGSEPHKILQIRLARGEITLKEYYEIKKELNSS